VPAIRLGHQQSDSANLSHRGVKAQNQSRKNDTATYLHLKNQFAEINNTLAAKTGTV
jgi:hypothetical protein